MVYSQFLYKREKLNGVTVNVVSCRA